MPSFLWLSPTFELSIAYPSLLEVLDLVEDCDLDLFLACLTVASSGSIMLAWENKSGLQRKVDRYVHDLCKLYE